MTKKLKKAAKPSIKDMTPAQLERDLDRAKKALGNKNLLPQSASFYSTRTKMIEAEIERRS